MRPSLAPLFTRLLEDVEVLEGRAARFDCKISGTPPPSVTWTHFGMALHPADVGGPPKAREQGPLLSLLCVPAVPPTGRAVEESENLRLRQDGGLHSLHIAHVGSEDEGLYAVSAANAHGQAHCSAQLYVEEPRTAATGPRYLPGAPVLPGPPLWGLSPVAGGAALGLWLAMRFLQLEAGEDAIYPRGAGAG